MRHPEHPADFRGVAEVSQGAQVNRAFGLCGTLAAKETPAPALSAPPAHRTSAVWRRVLEFDGDRLSSVFATTVLGTVVGEEGRGHEVSHASPWDLIGASGGK